jgi:CheY-like chemotaxis protein
MRILVVDNRFQSRWAIADWLSVFLDAVAIDSAASGAEAMATIGRRKPDVVLAASPMPQMDGIELTQLVKSQTDAPVVIVMTEKSDARFEAACESAGADFWLEKRHLQARLVSFLQRRFSLRLAPVWPGLP